MNPFHYRATIDRLARLAAKPNPSYVRVHAACALANELSPANPRRDLIRRMLEIANPVEHARHKLRDLYDRAPIPDLFGDPLGSLRLPLPLGESSLCPPLPLGEGWGEGPRPTDDEPTEEDNDPL